MDRFWAKVDKTSHSGGCWVWTAALQNGYGRFSPVRGTTFYAHRFAYELLVGPIPDGLTIDHLCRNTSCVNPAHLEPVTLAENVRRQVAPNSRKSRCPEGHPYDVLTGDGRRRCRQCTTRGKRAWRAARRAQGERVT